MKLSVLVAWSMLVLLTVGCATEIAGTAQPAVPVSAVTATAPTATGAFTSAESAFIAALDLNGYLAGDDGPRVEVGHHICGRWNQGQRYAELRTFMERRLDPEDVDLLIVLSARHLCPQHEGTYGG